jgi:hypothetical protein
MDKNNSLALRKASSAPSPTIPPSKIVFSAKTSASHRAKILLSLTRLASGTRTQIDSQLLENYADHLEKYDPETLASVFWTAEENYKFFPSIAEMMDDADEFGRNKRNSVNSK